MDATTIGIKGEYTFMKKLRVLVLPLLGLTIVAATTHLASAGMIGVACSSGNCDYISSSNGQSTSTPGKCGSYNGGGAQTCQCIAGNNGQEQSACNN